MNATKHKHKAQYLISNEDLANLDAEHSAPPVYATLTSHYLRFANHLRSRCLPSQEDASIARTRLALLNVLQFLIRWRWAEEKVKRIRASWL